MRMISPFFDHDRKPPDDPDAERQNANNLDGIIGYYARWIDKYNAHEMLRKFFNVG